MVHQCGFGQCGVEIYNSDEMCERHTADTGFLARGGPVNIVSVVKHPKGFWTKIKIFIATIILFIWASCFVHLVF